MADHRVVGLEMLEMLEIHRSFLGEAALESVMRKLGEGTDRKKCDRSVAGDNGRLPAIGRAHV